MGKPGRTLLAKIWDQHVIARVSEDTDLLDADRHLLHDLGGLAQYDGVAERH